MKVLLLNTYDIRGGAARAVFRINQGLRQIGVDSRMWVVEKKSHDPSVISVASGIRKKLLGPMLLADLLPLVFYPRRPWTTSWSIGWKKNDIARRVAREKPDLIHLNWVGRGFVPIRAVSRFHVPIVWTLLDMWPLTGGCHFPQDCDRYCRSCGRCPQLASHRENDLSRWVWRQKERHWRGLDLTVVAPSKWIEKSANASSLLHNHPVEQIPFGLDRSVFQPGEQRHCREIWGLPAEKRIILTGGIKPTKDPRKGFRLLQSATRTLFSHGWASKAELVVFGARTPSRPPDMGLRTTYVGYVEDDRRLSTLYSAADLFVAPSIQESFCQTVLEALSCGVPCVGFEVGGLPDMIQHQRTGYLARAFDIRDLAEGMAWALTNHLHGKRSVLEWRKDEGKRFSSTEIARSYARIYETLLSRRTAPPRAHPLRR